MTGNGNRTLEFSGAQIRAHSRHLATVVTIHGKIDAGNVDRIREYTQRFVLAKGPLVVDVSGVDSVDADAMSLFTTLDEACRAAGMQWTLVAGPAVAELLRGRDESQLPITSSVHAACRYFADVIVERRQMLLPLIRKSA